MLSTLRDRLTLTPRAPAIPSPPPLGARASQPVLLRLLRSSVASCQFGSSRSALRRRAPTTTTASADFCPALAEQISRGKTRDLRSICPSHLRPPVRVTLGFGSTRSLTPRRSPRMRFVSLGPELCLQLPSHLASRRRRCRSARGSCHRAPRGLSPPSHFPVGFRLPVACASQRSAPCPAHEWGPASALPKRGEGREAPR